MEPSTSSSRARSAGVLVPALALLVALAAGCGFPPPPPPPGDDHPPTVVFDIDGTLTEDELSNAAHPGGAAAVQAYVDKGYDVVYVTARWDLLFRSSTESWLESNGFPELPLHMAPGLLVTDDSRIDFKTDALTEIEETSPVLYAYGDSSTDFVAYANVGVPASQVFALQRASASSCQVGTWAACLPDYVGHLSYIAGVPGVD
jgi:phosphatidate phosphatase PAH1